MKSLKHSLLFLLFTLVTACAVNLCPAQSDQASESLARIRYIYSGMQSAHDNMKSVEIQSLIKTETHQGVEGEMLRDDTTSRTSHVDWKKNGSHVNIDMEYDSTYREKILSDGTSVRGSTATLNVNSDKSTFFHFEGFVDRHSQVFIHGLYRASANMDPRYYTQYSGLVPLSQYFKDNESKISYDGTEDIGSSKCSKISFFDPKLSQFREFWIDEEHGFSVVKRRDSIGTSKEDAEKIVEINATNLIESNGAWMPSLINISVDVKYLDEKKIPMGISTSTTVNITRFYNAKEGQVVSDLFTSPWPEGTEVDDRISNRTFVVRYESLQGGEQGQVEVVKKD